MIKLKSLLQEQTTVYKQGMSDPNVGTKEGPIAKIQQKLIDAGIMNPIPNTSYGIYGPRTNAAVIEFQIDNKLKPTGIVGSNTMSALNKMASTSNISDKSTTSNTTPSSTASEIANKLIKATESYDTDEAAIQLAVFSIKNQQTYDEVNKLLYNTKKYKDLVHFINSELGLLDRDRRTKLLNYLKTIVKTPDTRLDRTYFQKTAEKTAGTFEKTAGPLLFKFVDKFMGKDVIGPKFVQQYLLPKNLTDEDFNDFDRKTIGGVIADAIKQGQPVNKGAVSYKAYNNKIAQLLDTKFDPIAFTTALFTIQGWPQKLLNRLRFAFLFGQFNYKLDQKTKTYTIVEDPYDFSKSGSIKNWPSDDEIKGKTTSEVLQLIKDKNDIGDSWSEWYQILRAFGSIKDPENASNIVTMTMSGITLPDESSLLSRAGIV